MALGSGMAAQFGFGQETSYGLAVTVTRFVPLVSESLESQPDRQESAGIVAGARVIKSEQWQTGVVKCGGDVQLELYQQGAGTLFKNMFGSVTSSATAGVGTHTFSPGDLTGTSLTVQVGSPQVGGVVTPRTYAGVKVASWEIGVKADELATLGLTLIAKTETTGTSLAAVTYLTGGAKAFLAPAASLTTMTISGTAAKIRELTLSGDNGLSDERVVVGSSSLDEPLESKLRVYEGVITMEFAATSDYQQFLNSTEYPIVLSLLTSTAAITLNLNARFDAGTPNVDGTDLVVYDREFKCIASSMTNDATAITAVLINSQSTV